MPYASNKGADQSAHPCSLISTFVVAFLDSIIPAVAIAEISRLQIISAAEQAGLLLFDLNVHVVNRFLRDNRKSIPEK